MAAWTRAQSSKKKVNRKIERYHRLTKKRKKKIPTDISIRGSEVAVSTARMKLRKLNTELGRSSRIYQGLTLARGISRCCCEVEEVQYLPQKLPVWWPTFTDSCSPLRRVACQPTKLISYHLPSFMSLFHVSLTYMHVQVEK